MCLLRGRRGKGVLELSMYVRIMSKCLIKIYFVGDARLEHNTLSHLLAYFSMLQRLKNEKTKTKTYIFQVKNYSRDLGKSWTSYRYPGKVEVIILLFAIFCRQARSPSGSWGSSAASFRYGIPNLGVGSSGDRDDERTPRFCVRSCQIHACSELVVAVAGP